MVGSGRVATIERFCLPVVKHSEHVRTSNFSSAAVIRRRKCNHTILPGATRSQLKSGYLLHNCMNKLYNKSTTRSSAIADGPRDASCQLKSCQLPRNSTETTCTTTPEQIEVMKLEDLSMQKAVTLNTCCDVACLTFQLPHIATGSFQSHR